MPHIKQTSKEIRYLNKDFDGFRKSLMDFAKVYFPNTFNDFNESDPGMMFLEMSAYVGDVLSFYMDKNLKESLLLHADETANIYSLVQALGYKPRIVTSSTTTLDVFQLVPAIGTGQNTAPDYQYALYINDTFEASSESTKTVFQIDRPIDFSYSSSIDPTEVVVYQQNTTTGYPELYLLKKQIKAKSGEIKTTTFSFTDPRKFAKTIINANNIIEIIDVFDSDGNQWYEVPHLAQDTIFAATANTITNEPTLSAYKESSPYILKLKKTSRRFTTKVREDNTLELQFGAGITSNPDEEIIPNPSNVNIFGTSSTLSRAFDPSNFVVTRTYGQVPTNTTLTVRYLVGKGTSDNVPSNDITIIDTIEIEELAAGLDSAQVALARNSVAVINPVAAVGGRGAESIEEIKINAIASFNAQNRAVTGPDYIVRAYSLPSKFGAVQKAYIVQDDSLTFINDENATEDNINPIQKAVLTANPLALNLYTLGINNSGQLTELNDAVKQNLKTYIDQYRMITDAVNIKDAFIINIGIEFEIIALPHFNKKEVLIRCIDVLKDFFNIDHWQINQPIVMADVILAIARVHGVQSIANVEIINKFDITNGYSGNVYDIKSATLDSVIYPSLDPSIFEVKFPNKDIRGRVFSI